MLIRTTHGPVAVLLTSNAVVIVHLTGEIVLRTARMILVRCIMEVALIPRMMTVVGEVERADSAMTAMSEMIAMIAMIAMSEMSTDNGPLPEVEKMTILYHLIISQSPLDTIPRCQRDASKVRRRTCVASDKLTKIQQY
jgi:hypothetical protein